MEPWVHVIAHLSGGRLEMQVKIEKGRGYQPAEMPLPKIFYMTLHALNPHVLSDIIKIFS